MGSGQNLQPLQYFGQVSVHNPLKRKGGEQVLPRCFLWAERVAVVGFLICRYMWFVPAFGYRRSNFKR